MTSASDWLALVIGNSRFHWAYFQHRELQQAWDSSEAIMPPDWDHLPLYIASVVDSKIDYLQAHPQQQVITLGDIPLPGVYPSLGIDRALALWGAMEVWGYPCLVIDGGTSLTLSGANLQGHFSGGAILPGLGLQLNSLAVSTAALPRVNLPETLPPIWAKTTAEAINSGVIYTLLAGITHFLNHWWQQFPDSLVIFTGGDGEILQTYLIQQQPDLTSRSRFDSNLIFWGMRSLVTN